MAEGRWQMADDRKAACGFAVKCVLLDILIIDHWKLDIEP